jgi:hypothetical protein
MLIILVLLAVVLLAFTQWRRSGGRVWEQVFLAGFTWLFIECAAYIFLVIVAVNGGNFFLIGSQWGLDTLMHSSLTKRVAKAAAAIDGTYQLDGTLGWVPGRDKNYDDAPGTNHDALRALHEYTLQPPKDKLRVAAFGDSFVFCDNEKVPDSWPYIMEESMKGIEVLNFGVSGYGLGQSYLRYLKDGVKYHPDLVFFNYLLPTERDDVNPEMVLSGIPLTRADLYRVHFWLENGVLKSRSTRIDDWFDKKFRHERIYQPMGIDEGKQWHSNPLFSFSNALLIVKMKVLPFIYKNKIKGKLDTQAFMVNYAIVKDIIATARREGAMVLFYFHLPLEVIPPPVKQLLEENKDVAMVFFYIPLREAVYKSVGIGPNDLAGLSNETGHYNRKGNILYARTLSLALASGSWGRGARVFHFDKDKNAFVK